MTSMQRSAAMTLVSVLALSIAGCAQTGRTDAPAAAPQASAPAKPQAAAAAAAMAAATAGVNDKGEVVDSSKVTAGQGT